MKDLDARVVTLPELAESGDLIASAQLAERGDFFSSVAQTIETHGLNITLCEGAMKKNDKRGTMSKQVQEGDVIRLGQTLFVVEEAQMGGGGTAHGPHDVYPDAWQVKARALRKNGKYDPKGKIREFNQMTTCFTNIIDEVEVVGKMKRSVHYS